MTILISWTLSITLKTIASDGFGLLIEKLKIRHARLSAIFCPLPSSTLGREIKKFPHGNSRAKNVRETGNNGNGNSRTANTSCEVMNLNLMNSSAAHHNEIRGTYRGLSYTVDLLILDFR